MLSKYLKKDNLLKQYFFIIWILLYLDSAGCFLNDLMELYKSLLGSVFKCLSTRVKAETAVNCHFLQQIPYL